MLAFGRERRIGERRNRDFEIGLLGEIAVLGFVEGALEIIDLRTDVNAAAQSAIVIFAFERGELGQSGERQVDLGDGSRHAIVLQLHYKIRRELRRDRPVSAEYVWDRHSR